MHYGVKIIIEFKEHDNIWFRVNEKKVCWMHSTYARLKSNQLYQEMTLKIDAIWWGQNRSCSSSGVDRVIKKRWTMGKFNLKSCVTSLLSSKMQCTPERWHRNTVAVASTCHISHLRSVLPFNYNISSICFCHEIWSRFREIIKNWFDTKIVTDCCIEIQDFAVHPPISLTRVDIECIFERYWEIEK